MSTRSHDPRFALYPYWAADFLADPRVIHNIPLTLRRASVARALIQGTPLEGVVAARPRLTLSFDIERDMTEPFESAKSSTAEPFLVAFLALTRGTPLRATFFVQGEMVERLSEPLAALAAAGHSVGLHGYRHELWGRTNWITRREPVAASERARRLDLSLAAFMRAGLARPTSFRAPNFTIDATTYRLLEQRGFTIDSSPPSQKGNLYRPAIKGAIRVVPVSCAPLPESHRHRRLGVVTAAPFRQFNFDVYVDFQLARLDQLIEETLRFQQAQGIAPHLLMYAHNWEFYRQDRRALERLVERSLGLVQRYNLHPTDITGLAELVLPTAGG